MSPEYNLRSDWAIMFLTLLLWLLKSSFTARTYNCLPPDSLCTMFYTLWHSDIVKLLSFSLFKSFTLILVCFSWEHPSSDWMQDSMCVPCISSVHSQFPVHPPLSVTHSAWVPESRLRPSREWRKERHTETNTIKLGSGGFVRLLNTTSQILSIFIIYSTSGWG